jgi:hypothetical protein
MSFGVLSHSACEAPFPGGAPALPGVSSPTRTAELLKQTSFIIHYRGWQPAFGSFAPDSDYRSLVCSREIRPLAFLDPRAFHGTYSQRGLQ